MQWLLAPERLRREGIFKPVPVQALLKAHLAGRLVLRVLRPPLASENQLITLLANRVLGAVFGAEAPLVSRHNLLRGVSLLAVARRPATAVGLPKQRISLTTA